MTRRHDLDSHRFKLQEISSILDSMKTLSVMEVHKLEHFIESQKKITESIERIAADFLHFYPDVLPDTEPESNIILLIGSERGFCGDFNEQLIKQLDTFFTQPQISNTLLIAVGSKLHPLLKGYNHQLEYIKGTDIVEDINMVVELLSDTLSSYQQPASLYALYHNTQHKELIKNKLLPPFKETDYKNVKLTSPPVLNLTQKDFLLELTEHYLFNVLHRILYISLMIENQHRIQHLDNAIHYLEDKTDELLRKINSLRQEEIIEEIEVILLNASMSSL